MSRIILDLASNYSRGSHEIGEARGRSVGQALFEDSRSDTRHTFYMRVEEGGHVSPASSYSLGLVKVKDGKRQRGTVAYLKKHIAMIIK